MMDPSCGGRALPDRTEGRCQGRCPRRSKPPAPAGDGDADHGGEACDDRAGSSDGDAPDTEPEGDGRKPLSDRLMMELTAHRTLALRSEALGDTAWSTARIPIFVLIALAAIFLVFATQDSLTTATAVLGFGLAKTSG
ncbi:hypothetical protein JCM17845_28790 [Iodidimonas gelatinilytica]|uniref:Uncharacterized protein n=2 Tax=Iodidimonas gelatinilytica TaxID=1236966 RepID=A0A5A7N5H8_9PROT|nr:hypothetical protein JCM17845_28790 [Iodidimonas gelatinilytica]